MSDGRLTFWKLEALGNDFVLLDLRREVVDLDDGMVRQLGDRRLGVGFDQLLVLTPGGNGATGVEIRNADGTRAEQCGNGMRAIAAWLDQRGELADRMRLDSPAGEIRLARDASGYTAEIPSARPADPAELGLSIPELPPEATGWQLITTGNPHLVVDWPVPPDAGDLQRVSERVQSVPSWANRVNIGLLHRADDRHGLLRVWERGAGPTPACGSGAVAAAYRMALVAPNGGGRRIDQPGGSLVVHFPEGSGSARLQGPARVVFEGTIPWPSSPRPASPTG